MSRLLRIRTQCARNGSATYKTRFLSFCDTPEMCKVEKSNADPSFDREGLATVQISSSRHELQYSWSREAVYPSGSSTGATEVSSKLVSFSSRTLVVLGGGRSYKHCPRRWDFWHGVHSGLLASHLCTLQSGSMKHDKGRSIYSFRLSNHTGQH